MRIALIYDAVFPFVVGGAEHRNYEIARVLSEQHDMSLYGFHYWKDSSNRQLPGCQYIPVAEPTPLYNAKGKRRVAEALYFAGWLGVALFRGTEHVWDLSSFPYFSVPVARFLNLFKANRLVVTWHEFWGEHWKKYMGWRGVIGCFIERLALRCSPFVIVVSEHTRRRLIEAGYPRERITVIPNGIDWERIQRIAPAPTGAELVYAGRLVSHKRVDLLIRAVRELSGPRLDIIGDGPQRAELERLTDEVGVRSRVTFLGELPTAEEVFARFKACRVLCQASEREGFGMTVLQGLACGLSGLVCRQLDSAAPELIDAALKGRVVDPTPSAIANGCRELLAESPKAWEEGRQRRIASARDYDWPHIAERLLEVYERLPSRYPTRPPRKKESIV